LSPIASRMSLGITTWNFGDTLTVANPHPTSEA
jgi:hypothetical protein